MSYIPSSGGTTTSGTYTPTLTKTTNVDATVSNVCQYLRVGNTVTVSGRIEIDCTANATQTVLDMSLPIASVFTGSTQCGGVAAIVDGASNAIAIVSDSGLGTASFRFISTNNVNNPYAFTFTYQIL